MWQQPCHDCTFVFVSTLAVTRAFATVTLARGSNVTKPELIIISSLSPGGRCGGTMATGGDKKVPPSLLLDVEFSVQKLLVSGCQFSTLPNAERREKLQI